MLLGSPLLLFYTLFCSGGGEGGGRLYNSFFFPFCFYFHQTIT